MKRILLLILTLNILHGTDNITVDGIIDETEWQDAQSFDFKENEIVNVEVLLKQNNNNLYIAYIYSDLKDSTYVFPEIFIDTQMNKGYEWQEDDYWFHVSGSDCYSIGEREDYSNCTTEDIIWKAVPNYPFGNEFEKIEVFEIVIPLNFIDVEKGQKVGICFSVAIFPHNTRINYPSNADENIPETWLELDINN